MTTFIGIDPAFRPGGFWVCILDTTDKTAAFRGFDTVGNFLKWLYSADAPEQAFWCVENSNLQNASFDLTGNAKTVARKARNVGANQAVSEITVQACVSRYGAKNVLGISPQQKGAKIESNPMFLRIVQGDGFTLDGYGKEGNQDKRDAYKLASIGKQQMRFHQMSKK